MNKDQQTGATAARLVAACIGTAGSFTLFAAYIIIPPAGLFSGLLAPFPAVFCHFRYGRATAAIITLGTTALLARVFGIQTAALYLAQCGVIAHLMPELLYKGYGVARTMVWTTAANLIVYFLAALAITIISDQDIHRLAVTEINSSISQAIAIYEKAGVKGDELEVMKKSMSMAAAVIARIYPALMTVMLIAMTGCNIALIRRFTSRLSCNLKIGEFNEFKTPESLVWLLIAAGFAMMADNPIINTPALNLLVILTVFYFLQGLAVISTIIARQSFSGFLRIGLYLMLMLQPYMAALVAALGIFDLWGDFRTPRKQENL